MLKFFFIDFDVFEEEVILMDSNCWLKVLSSKVVFMEFKCFEVKGKDDIVGDFWFLI